MADDYFDLSLAWQPGFGPLPGAEATVYAITDTEFTTPLELTDVTDVPMTALVADSFGMYPQFKVVSGETDVLAKSGDLVTAVTSRQGLKGDPGDPGDPGVGIPDLGSGSPGMVLTNLGDAAGWATSAAGIIGAPAVWPDAFPPLPTNTLLNQLRNGTSPLAGFVLSALAAADPQAFRQQIGAGTGNGTSNLTLGNAGTQAMPGNRVFDATEVTAPANPSAGLTAGTVASQLAQAAATGSGGGGSSSVYVWRYSSGAYPTLPSSKPAGVDVVQAYGPVAPTIVPSWVGNGSGQALGRYEYAALT